MSRQNIVEYPKPITKTMAIHICDRCGVKSSPVDRRYKTLLPQGWSHLRHVTPVVESNNFAGALEEDIEMDFCHACTEEILHGKQSSRRTKDPSGR